MGGGPVERRLPAGGLRDDRRRAEEWARRAVSEPVVAGVAAVVAARRRLARRLEQRFSAAEARGCSWDAATNATAILGYAAADAHSACVMARLRTVYKIQMVKLMKPNLSVVDSIILL